MACCVSLNCNCGRFTQSAFTGYGGRQCSGCGHNREYHFSFLSGSSLQQQIKTIKIDQGLVLPSELARAIITSIKPSKKRWFFSSEIGLNYLNLLPKDLIIIVCQYINDSSYPKPPRYSVAS